MPAEVVAHEFGLEVEDVQAVQALERSKPAWLSEVA
jgi:hypothetical protein